MGIGNHTYKEENGPTQHLIHDEMDDGYKNN